MSILGCTLYRWGGDVEAKVRLLQPHYVVVGSGCWNDLPAIAAACPPGATFILRNMADNLIDLNPNDVAAGICDNAFRIGRERCVAHALNESYSDASRAAAWELKFIEFCRGYSVRTICLNGAYGNDPDERFKGVAELSELVGWHLYDGFSEDRQQYIDRVHTSRRYARDSWPDWWPRHKHIATEVGIESFPGTGQRRGWHDMGLSEVAVKDRMMANAMEWYADGLLGECWFNAGHTEGSWNEGYGMTELQARAWSKLPAPRKEEEGEEMADLQVIQQEAIKGQEEVQALKQAVRDKSDELADPIILMIDGHLATVLNKFGAIYEEAKKARV